MVDLAIGLLNDSAGAVVRAVAKKETGDDVLAATAAESVKMSERVEATIKLGAIQCAKKYSVSMKYAPEVMLGGGLLIWAGQVKLAIHSLKQKGAEIRQRAEGRGQGTEGRGQGA